MTEKEREQLKDEIKIEVLKEIGNNPTKKGHRNKKLDELREKYIDELHKKFGNYYYWDVWVNIRQLSCYLGGIRYVRDIDETNIDKVLRVAESLIKQALAESEI